MAGSSRGSSSGGFFEPGLFEWAARLDAPPAKRKLTPGTSIDARVSNVAKPYMTFT